MRDGIAHLRAAWATHPDDDALNDLITECLIDDADVARWWAEPDVTPTGRGHKVIRHPEHGVIATDFEVLTPLNDPDQVLVVHRAVDDQSRTALNRSPIT